MGFKDLFKSKAVKEAEAIQKEWAEELFKSKAVKEAEAIQKEWAEELITAKQQLESSKYDYSQFCKFFDLLKGRDIRNWLSRVQILVRNNLSDGSPVLSKFFLRSVSESTIKCRIAIHDSSILEPIKELGFGIVRLGGPNIYEKDVGKQAAKGLFMMEFCDTYDMGKIVEKCNQYYDALLKVKDRVTSREVICYPKYTKIEWGYEGFKFETELTPSRVDEIIAGLPHDCEYLKEYREYMINCLADSSIKTDHAIRKVKQITYNQPVVYCQIYSNFAISHKAKLDFEAKNKEFESVINEVREAAQKKIDTEI